MKKALFGTIALAAMFASPALAADLPVKAPPPPPPVYSWTGFYIGGTLGGAFNESRYDLFPTGCFIAGCPGSVGAAGNPFRTDSRKFDSRVGVAVGGTLGYNWQVSPTFVAGLEADFNFTDLNQSLALTQTLPSPPFGAVAGFAHTVSQKQDWLGTFRARLGWLVTPAMLLYGTGGLAYGHVSSSFAGNFPPPGAGDTYVGSASSTRVGWTAGGGFEYAVGGGWSAKFEYLYVELGKFTYAAACGLAICTAVAPPPSFGTSLTTREHIGRFGLNYKFGAPAVIARY